MKNLLLFVLSTFLLASCGQQASMPNRAWEGSITQVVKFHGLPKDFTQGNGDSIKGPQAQQMEQMGALLGMLGTVTINMYVREDKVAYEMSTLGGFAKIRSIIDRTNRTLTVLLPNKTARVTNLRAFDTVRARVDDSIRQNPGMLDTLANALPEPTGRKKTLEGFAVEEYITSANGMDIELWLTTDSRMKFYEVMRDALLGRQRTGAGGLEEFFALIAPFSGKVPVSMTARMNGELFMTSELRDIDEGPVDDDKFAIPAGYKIVTGDSLHSEED